MLLYGISTFGCCEYQLSRSRGRQFLNGVQILAHASSADNLDYVLVWRWILTALMNRLTDINFVPIVEPHKPEMGHP
jgi:hypothetical protein